MNMEFKKKTPQPDINEQMEQALVAGQRDTLGLTDQLMELFPDKKPPSPPAIETDRFLQHGPMPNLDADGRVLEMRQGGLVKVKTGEYTTTS